MVFTSAEEFAQPTFAILACMKFRVGQCLKKYILKEIIIKIFAKSVVIMLMNWDVF